jgi:hypothetical protein
MLRVRKGEGGREATHTRRRTDDTRKRGLKWTVPIEGRQKQKRQNGRTYKGRLLLLS